MLYLLIDEQRRQNCMAEISGLDLKRIKSVEIKEYRKNRSDAQNRTMWMWLHAIEAHLDTPDITAEDLHETFKQRFLGLEEKKVTFAYNGMVVRELMVRPKSTKTLTVQEMTLYLRKIEHLAAEMSIALPYPDDFKYAMEVA